ncbi:glycosyltransferase [Amaricoccus sp. W119]|uniref:glycosyltransferase n=1 Tax=Amaricoccus sp. W119 TaxID=3391833 RepID=UPI0039A5C90D
MTLRLAIVDPLTPVPYSGDRESLAGLGGTEATVVRVAERLAPGVTVFQTGRVRSERVSGVAYAAFDPARALPGAPEIILVINSWKVALRLRRAHPDARIALWMHVFPGRHNRVMGPALAEAEIEIIGVSASHARALRSFLHMPRPPITHVFNPISDDLRPDATRRDPNLLLFASSPHKGLDEVYRAFGQLRARLPSLRLAVADPGYLRWRVGLAPEGVEHLGRLDPSALVSWMRRALCLFYPQTRFAETFGLVIAEANAVGCPALLHAGLGANDEVASDPSQLIDARDPDAIAARVLAWRATSPIVRARPEFRLSAVIEAWRSELSRPAPTRTSAPAEAGA